MVSKKYCLYHLNSEKILFKCSGGTYSFINLIALTIDSCSINTGDVGNIKLGRLFAINLFGFLPILGVWSYSIVGLQFNSYLIASISKNFLILFISLFVPY